jgi:rare lipoprotein A
VTTGTPAWAAWRFGLGVLCAAWLAGCSIQRPAPQPQPDIRVPPPPPDLASIPDAQPRIEPRSRYGNPPSYVVFGNRYALLPTADGYVERGTASWYGPGFHAERTSSGEPYDMYAMTAAHKTLPIPVYAEVTNLRNGRRVVVRINDRGPFVGDRLIDLSYTAASKLDMLREGTAPVEVRVLAAGVPTMPAAAATIAGATPPAAATPPAVATPPAAAAPPTITNWLQLGSFAQRDNAERLLARLAAAGIGNARIDQRRDAGGERFRVRLGPISNAMELDDYSERLRLLGIGDARLAHD